MKIAKKIVVFLIVVALYAGCENSISTDNSASQNAIIDSINVDYKGENNVVFYQFSTQKKVTVKHDIWDIAVDSGLNIIANSGAYGTGVSTCSTDSINFDSDYSTYSDSGFSMFGLGNFDGWIDMSSMPPKYTGKVFIVKTEDKKMYKIQIVGATKSSGISLTIKIDSLSGSGVAGSVFSKDANYDYAYIDLGTKSVVVFAPKIAEWDVKFMRTEWLMGTSVGGHSSILLNTFSGVKAYLLENSTLDAVTSVINANFSTNAHTIGHHWYTFDKSTMTFAVDNNVSIIKTPDEKVFKLQMSTFYGGSDGKKQFTSIFEFEAMK